MNCPLCNQKTENFITRKLRKGESQNVYYCSLCDLGFLENLKTNAEIKNYYQESYRREFKPNLKKDTSPEELFNCYVEFQEERIKLLEPFLDKEKRLLEIGCSAGMFLYHVRDRVKEVVGLDFDHKSADYASEKCNCSVYAGQLIDTPLQKKSFDVICLFQTLEHIRSPLELILQIKEYLKSDGILYIEVPNLYDALLSTYNIPYYQQFYYHTAHLYYFSKRSLSLLLRNASFSGNFHFTQDYNILNHFYWIFNNRPQPTCIPGLSRPEFPFYQGVDKNVRNRLNSFLDLFNQEYGKILFQFEITSNISFIGSIEEAKIKDSIT